MAEFISQSEMASIRTRGAASPAQVGALLDEIERLNRVLEVARAGVARYVNAQGKHLYESWRDHLIECCDLERGTSGPYPTVKAGAR